jgi:hypothetical protein
MYTDYTTILNGLPLFYLLYQIAAFVLLFQKTPISNQFEVIYIYGLMAIWPYGHMFIWPIYVHNSMKPYGYMESKVGRMGVFGNKNKM